MGFKSSGIFMHLLNYYQVFKGDDDFEKRTSFVEKWILKSGAKNYS